MRRWMGLLAIVIVGAGAWLLLSEDERPPSDEWELVEDGAEPSRVTLLGGTTPIEPVSDAVLAKPWPRGHASIEVVTVDAQGRVVPDVPVALRFEGWRHRNRRDIERVQSDRGLTAPVIRSARTDGQGRARFAGLDPTKLFTVQATPAPPYAANRLSMMPRSTWTTPAQLVLIPGTPLTVRLLDADGRGRAGSVQLHLVLPDWDGAQGRVWESPSFATNESGHLKIAHVPPGTYLIEAVVPNYATRTGIPVRVPTDDELIIAMGDDDGATAYGTVSDSDGAPLEGVTILVRTVVSYSVESIRAAQSDAQGQYRIDGLSARGSVRSLHCEHPGLTPSRVKHPKPFAQGEQRQVDFTMRAGASVAGRVMTSDGVPVAAAAVAVHVTTDLQFGHRADVVADSDGRFVFDALPAGRGLFAAHAPGLLPVDEGEKGLRTWPGKGYRLTLGAEAPEPLQLQLTEAPPWGGVAFDAEGKPMAGVTVRALGPNAKFAYFDKQTAVTDAKGRFRFVGLEADDELRVQLSRGSRAMFETTIRLGPDNTIRWPLRGSVAGRIEWVGGAPSGTYHQRSDFVFAQQPGSASATTPIASNGTFHFAELSAGTWSLFVNDVFGLRAGDAVEVKVSDGMPVRDVVLRPPALLTIEGLLVDHKGAPLPDQQVTASAGDGGKTNLSARTTALGRFRFSRLPAGTYHLFIRWLVPERVSVEAGDTNVRLVGRAPAVVSGRVTLQGGGAVASAEFEIWERNRAVGTTHVEDGDFRYECQFAELRTIGIAFRRAEDSRGERMSIRPFFIPAHYVDQPVAIELTRGRRARVEVVDTHGAPVPSARVWVQHHSIRGNQGNPNAHLITDAFGLVELTGLPDALVRVGVVPPPTYAQPPAMDLTVAQDHVRVRLQAGGSISGRVLDPSGKPASGCGVSFHAKTQHLHSVVAPDGSFELTGVALGEAGTVRAAFSAQAPKYEAVEVHDVRAGALDVRLQFSIPAAIRGTVRDPDGKPVVTSVWAEPAGGGERRHTRSQADGTFVLKALRDGTVYSLGAAATGPWLMAEAVTARAPADDVAITLTDGPRVSGRVVGANPGNLRVWLSRPQGAGYARHGSVSQADGSFEFASGFTAPGILLVRDPRGKRYALLDAVLAPRAGIELALQPALEITGTIEGLHESSSHVLVTAKRGALWIHGTVNRDRTFRIECMPPGTYELHVQAYGTKQSAVVRDAKAGASGILIKLDDK